MIRARLDPILVLSLTLGLLAPAAALEIQVTELPSVAFAGDTVELRVELTDLSEDLRNVELRGADGLTVRGPMSQGQSVTIVNGERRVAYPLLWEIHVPETHGSYPLGVVVCTTTGGEETTRALPAVTVVRRAEPDTQLLLIDAPAGGPVGYPFVVTYTLLTSEAPHEERGAFGDARNPFGLRSLSLAPLEAGLACSPLRVPGLPTPTELSLGNDRTLIVHEGLREHEGRGYHASAFALEVIPKQPGPIDLSARARVKVVVGSERQRTLFGERRVARGEERDVRSAEVVYRVASLPPNPPPGFSGAVGRYTIRVDAAYTEANAYDPIPVTITIEGQGLLDDVTLPRWQDLPEITSQFQVASDVDPGQVDPAARTKTFTKRFRATSAEVQALPALPFPYYDPSSGSYQVAYSEPIPLEIRAVQTVTAEDAVGGTDSGPQPATSGAEPAPIAARGGIQANYTDLDDVVPELRRLERLDALVWLALAAPPLGLLTWLLAGWLRARAPAGPRPLAVAQAACAGPDADLDAVRAALHTYARARLGLHGEVTPAELEQALRARVVPPDTVSRARALWSALEAARFSGDGQLPEGILPTLEEGDRCLG